MIGPTHRYAATLDGHYELVAGVFSRDPAKSRAFAAELGIATDRRYVSYAEMAAAESARADGIEAVSIVTPNDSHAPASRAFLERGIHVLCDKPMATSLADALEVWRLREGTELEFALTHNYAGYPMVREARDRIASGELGRVRVVMVEHASGGRSRLVEAQGDEKTRWRTDPRVGGPSAVLGDLGTHAHHLARYVTCLEPESVSAELSTMVAGRTSHDNAHVTMRFAGGARGHLWASYVAAGNRHGLRLRVFCESAGLEWDQESPEVLTVRALDGPPIEVRRGDAWTGEAARRVTRVKAGQPEGVLEAFANIYGDVAERIRARRERRAPNALAGTVADARDGVLGMRFIAAAVESDARGGAWVDAGWPAEAD